MTFPDPPKIPGLTDDDITTSITESPYRVGALGENIQAGLISTVDVDAGEDDWDKPLSAEHPRPVVLVHGTFGNRGYGWTTAAPLLRENGYRIFRLDYGQYNNPLLFGLDDVKHSAQQLKEFVDDVLARTGAEKADIVGFSQGAMMPRWYLGALGGAGKVHHFVGISGNNHGLTSQGMMRLARQIPGAKELVERGAVQAAVPCWPQLMHDHPFMRELADLGETQPGVRYTTIATKYDDIVTPYTSTALVPREGHDVTNIVLQDIDPGDHSSHLAMPYNPTVLKEVLKALAS